MTAIRWAQSILVSANMVNTPIPHKTASVWPVELTSIAMATLFQLVLIAKTAIIALLIRRISILTGSNQKSLVITFALKVIIAIIL